MNDHHYTATWAPTHRRGTPRIVALLPPEVVAHLARALADAAHDLAPVARRFARNLQQHAARDEHAPDDPMARALWLRQRRHTGPAVRHRAPRRIDARTSRAAPPAGPRSLQRRGAH